MRVAVMSDIHGFNLALDTVLNDLQTEAQSAPIDQVVVAGDLFEDGPGPDAVFETLRDGAFTVVHGNTDLDIVESVQSGSAGEEVRFVLDRIGAEGVAWLADLPFAHRITPPDGTSPDDDLLVVHANPYDVEQKLLPEASDRELREIIGETRAAAIAFGHHHVCYVRRLDRTLLADISAVGNPKDGDLRCKWGLFTWDGSTRTWQVELRKPDYPLEATAAQILASDLPEPERSLRRLKRASY